MAEALYHGTRLPFSKGGYLFPAEFHGGERRPGSDDDGGWVYMTDDFEQAVFYALNTPPCGRSKPKVLTVEPAGPVEIDPSKFTNEQGCQFRSRHQARIVAVTILDPKEYQLDAS